MLHVFLDSLVRVYVRRPSVRLKYYPQHPVPKLPQIITSCCVTDQISQPYNLSCKNTFYPEVSGIFSAVRQISTRLHDATLLGLTFGCLFLLQELK
jgi:hypothetical protein